MGSSTIEPEDTCAAALPSLPAQDSATSPNSGPQAALFLPRLHLQRRQQVSAHVRLDEAAHLQLASSTVAEERGMSRAEIKHCAAAGHWSHLHGVLQTWDEAICLPAVPGWFVETAQLRLMAGQALQVLL